MRSKSELLGILGLRPDASPREVRRAFRQLVLALHPDRQGGDAQAAARLRRVVGAYEELLGRVRARSVRRARSTPAPVARGPYLCPRCEESYGAVGDCPRCALPVVALDARATAPADPAVDAMIAALEARQPSRLVAALGPRLPVATISSLLVAGALALTVHGPVATLLVGYGLLLFVGESVGRSS